MTTDQIAAKAGRDLWNQRNGKSVEQFIEAFKAAIEKALEEDGAWHRGYKAGLAATSLPRAAQAGECPECDYEQRTGNAAPVNHHCDPQFIEGQSCPRCKGTGIIGRAAQAREKK